MQDDTDQLAVRARILAPAHVVRVQAADGDARAACAGGR